MECEHKRVMISQRADQTAWCFYCRDCNLHGDKARTRKAAERKWKAMVKAQSAWRAKSAGLPSNA